MRCAMHPKFLAAGASAKAAAASEGRRFLVFLFGLHPSLVEGLHATMKNQLPLASSRVQRVYGDLYLRAWKATSEPTPPAGAGKASAAAAAAAGATAKYQRAVEACVQDLMSCSVHAASPKTHAACRGVLAVLHEAKGQRGVEPALCRLWEPILWRALKVANPVVRAQATALLEDAFPLMGDDAEAAGGGGGGGGPAPADELLQRQFDALRALLEDPDPRVRVAACAATAHILRGYWEAIPSATSRVLLTLLVGTLAADKSSAPVRAAAVGALSALLDQPLAHAALKAALPSLRNLVHDANERVRAAVVALLQRVSTVRGIKFTAVVPVEHLLARLAHDHARGAKPVTTAIARLLAPSYFPDGAGGADGEDGDEGAAAAAREKLHLARCVGFLKSSPTAALAFYATAVDHVALPTLARLAVLLFSYARTASAAAAAAEEEGQGAGTEECDGDAQGDEAPAAAETPDKRSKRKRKGAKAPKGGVGADTPASPGEVAAARRALVVRVLECAAVVWESLLPAMAKPASSKAGRAATAERAALAAALGDEASGLPALYGELLGGGLVDAPARAACLRLAASLRQDEVVQPGGRQCQRATFSGTVS